MRRETSSTTTTLLLLILSFALSGQVNGEAILGEGVLEAFYGSPSGSDAVQASDASAAVPPGPSTTSVNVLLLLKGEDEDNDQDDETSSSSTMSSLGAMDDITLQTAQQSVGSSIADQDATVSFEYATLPAMAVTLNNEAALAALMSNPNVKRIELDEEIKAIGSLRRQNSKITTEETKPAADKTDKEQRQLDHETQSYPDQIIRSTERLALGNDGNGVTVAVFDTGCDADHADLGPAIVDEACFLANGACPRNREDTDFGPGSADDDDGHGTHVAGIVTSRGNDSPRGIAPATNIVCVKILNSRGSGSQSGTIAGLEWLMNNYTGPAIDLINMSFGGSTFYSGICDSFGLGNQLYAAALTKLLDQGVLTLAAAGNDFQSYRMPSPACISTAFSVGASDHNDNAASFTNSNTQTNVFAPGTNVDAAALGGGSIVLSGTSMATPVTTGCAALLIQSGDTTTPYETAARLELSDVIVSHYPNSYARVNCKPDLKAVCNSDVEVVGCDLTDDELIAAIDGGSIGGPVSYVFEGLDDVGDNNVFMTITDDFGLQDSCNTTVTVTGPVCATKAPTTTPTGSPSTAPSSTPTQAPTEPLREFTVEMQNTMRIPASGNFGSTTITLDVTDSQNDCEIADLDFEIRLQHSHATDLDVRLCSPDFTCVWLFTDLGSSYALDLPKTLIFDDDAAENIRDSIFDPSPVYGRTEFGSLSSFKGKYVLGEWDLYINDDENNWWSGYFYSMALHVKCKSGSVSSGARKSFDVAGLFPVPAVGTSGLQRIGLNATLDGEEEEDCIIQDLDVVIEMYHTFSTNLDVKLCSPDNTCVWLWTEIGSSYALDSRKTILLDDEATSNIASSIFWSSPVGTPKWDQLSKFDGESVLGEWTLELFDVVSSYSGFVYSFEISVQCAASSTV